MAKIDKSQYSKEEWRRIKEQRRQEKEAKQQPTPVEIVIVPVPATVTENKYFVLCLKHGTKYSADYVNRLYNMVKRNCRIDYEFVCMTEDANGLDSNIKSDTITQGIIGLVVQALHVFK